MTAPVARNKSLHSFDVEPKAAPLAEAGSMPLVATIAVSAAVKVPVIVAPALAVIAPVTSKPELSISTLLVPPVVTLTVSAAPK